MTEQWEMEHPDHQNWDDMAEAMLLGVESGALTSQCLRELKVIRKERLWKRTGEMTWGAN